MKLSSSLIWQTIASPYMEIKENDETKTVKNPDLLLGEPIPSKSLSYDSEEFGIISQKEIVEIMVQVFGAKASRNKERHALTFDKLKLERLSKIYDISIDVKIGTGAVTDVTGVGLDRHLNQESVIIENTITKARIGENYEEKGEITPQITYEKDTKGPPDPDNASQASQALPGGESNL